MEKLLLEKIEQVKDQMLTDIISITKIDSVRTDFSIDKPFGSGVNEALLKSMEISKNLGFETKIVQNCVGVAQLGEGNQYLGMVGHLDVVPAIGKWITPPFSCDIRDNKIYARGILDNKGPIICCLYAAYILKECGYKFKTPLRVLFGTNEETGMEDMKTYLKHELPPIFGWTPDCKYPVVYAERGRLNINLLFYENSHKEDFLNCYVLYQKNSEKLMNIDFSDKEFGALQIRDIKSFDNKISLIISYPASVNTQKIIDTISNECENIKVELVSDVKPVFFDKELPLIKILSNTYEDVTKLDGTPVTTTGGTYAKVMPNIVPFGPSFPNQKGIGHLPDEWMDIDDIMQNLRIYTIALYNCLKEMDK